MQTIQYPLLYYQLSDNDVLGMLVGTDYQIMDRDLRRVRKALQDYLQRQYKKLDTYPYLDIREPKMKVLKIGVRPTFREQYGSYPLPYTLKVPVPVVYGQIEQEYYECYLPLFRQSFFYYDARQFESLVKHFATKVLNDYSPAEIFRLMQYPAPAMELVNLRVNVDRQIDWRRYEQQREYRTLQRLAEQHPFPKSVKRSMNALPEAAWEMEDKVSEVINKLLNTRSNVILVGHSGVGKSAVLQQAIRKITQLSKDQKLSYTFWRIMPQRITASAKYLGEWEETMEALVGELQLANGILWVVDLIQLLLGGGYGPEDSVAAFLMAFMQRNQLQIIGEATPQELNSMRRLLPGFVEHFQIIQIEDPTEQKVQAILQQFVGYVKLKHQVTITAEALALAYRLLHRFYPYESFPGKGIKFLGQCVNEAKLSRRASIDKKDVVDFFVGQTGMPELFLRDDLLLDKQKLRQYFEKRIIGQPAAVDKLCEIVKVFKAGLNNPHRPISTLLFAGPTGVGKTASAKALADYFFGKGQKRFPLIRIDMSEFQHPNQLHRLVGSGRETGQLVREIREKPFSVLLLDEVEKADPAIFDALLTVIDEGMLTDSYGRLTNFRNTIIIMTTNLGASSRTSIGFQTSAGEEQLYRSAINQYFRPEFVNRIDGIVVFRPLEQEHIVEIARKELEELKRREGFAVRNLSLEFGENVVAFLTRIGFDERYGARPLQRAIEQHIVSPVANWLLDHPGSTDCTLYIDYEQGEGVKVGTNI